MIVVMGVAVLLFGKRLPEVGRSLGKGIVEFKKGLRGIEDELDFSASDPLNSRRPEDRHRPAGPETSIPKFEPPTAAAPPQEPFTPPYTQD
jgi:sec-independent protein translocase protein TatA